MSPKSHVLIVDDEPQFLRALATGIRGAGYEVETATTAEEALMKAGLRTPDAIILDLVLPDRSGTDVARELREWTQVPIVVVSAVGEEQEKISALDAGADDYVTKPFAIGELLARLRAVLRRAGPPNGEPVLSIGELTIDLDKQQVMVGDRHVRLTPHEFGLLRLLAQNEGKLLTHKTILREVWGAAYQMESSYLHVYVSQLRKKLEPDPDKPRYILTEPRAGYRLVDPAVFREALGNCPAALRARLAPQTYARLMVELVGILIAVGCFALAFGLICRAGARLMSAGDSSASSSRSLCSSTCSTPSSGVSGL